MKHAKGKCTDKQVDRASYLTGNVANNLERVFAKNVAEVDMLEGGRGVSKSKEQVRCFVEEYQEDKPYARIPGRAHAHFKHFSAKKQHQHIKKKTELNRRLNKHSRNLDRARYASNLPADH